MRTGRIGNGKKTHYIVEGRLLRPLFNRKSLCGKRGKITLNLKEVTCWHCKRCNGDYIPGKGLIFESG